MPLGNYFDKTALSEALTLIKQDAARIREYKEVNN